MADSLSMIGRLSTGMLALAVLAAPLGVHAQAYPGKTLRLILPFPPSGSTVTLGRGVAQTLSAQILSETRGTATAYLPTAKSAGIKPI